MMDLKKYKNVHCIGIGGIGLSGIAEILLSRGYRVTGSDMKASDITEKLERMGATVYIGHKASNVEEAELIIAHHPHLSHRHRRVAQLKEITLQEVKNGRLV